MRKDKIENIAKITGLSPITIKRFFYTPDKLRIETLRQIMSVLSKYYPEDLRKIAQTDYRDILFIFPDNNLMIIWDILKMLQKIALKYNFQIRIYENRDYTKLNELININRKKWQDIRGIITLGTQVDKLPEDFLVPTVFINTPPQLYGLNLDIDDYLGGKLAIEHLYLNSWKKPIFLTYEYIDKPSKDRYNGVKAACETLNLDCKLITSKDFSMEDAYITAKKALEKEDIDSIFFFSDQMAIGGIKAINEYGYKIGEDIGIIGFDNLEISEFLGLSSISQMLYEKLLFSVEYILYGNGKLFDEKLPTISYSPELVIRKSSVKNPKLISAI